MGKFGPSVKGRKISSGQARVVSRVCRSLYCADKSSYGELGRIIIIDHFQLLRRLNYMMPNIPPAKSASELSQDVVTAIDPLSPSDFIANVLVPEAANFLIMQDGGQEGFDQAAYEAASKTRAESSKYGEWKFPRHRRVQRGCWRILGLVSTTREEGWQRYGERRR